jgi:acyl carrier protein
MNALERELRNFLSENFAVDGSDAIGVQESLIGSGIVDSTGLLELVSFVENTYALEVPDQDLLPDNFETIERIVTYVSSRLTPANAAAAAQPSDVR